MSGTTPTGSRHMHTGHARLTLTRPTRCRRGGMVQTPIQAPAAENVVEFFGGGQGPRTAWLDQAFARGGLTVGDSVPGGRGRAPKRDLRLWRGPDSRTTVADALGRMATRWGRMKAIVQDRYGSADVLDFRRRAPRVRSRGRAGQGRGRWRGLGRLALDDRSAVPHAHPRLRAAGTEDPGPGYQRRRACRRSAKSAALSLEL